MKRISRALILTLFAITLFGGTSAFAGTGTDNGKGNDGVNNGNNNGQGNNGNNQGNNGNKGDDYDGGTWANGGGSTAPIDGGIGILLLAGAGLGIKKAAARRKQA